MDAKTEAQHRREIADALDVVADKFQPLSTNTTKAYRSKAQANRNFADELDPPQPEWQAGDLVRDKNGGVWRHDGKVWRSPAGAYVRVSDLPALYGQIRKAHIADPAKQEVVVSLDGIDRAELDSWAHRAECGPGSWVQSKTAIRAALAAREQLGEVQ